MSQTTLIEQKDAVDQRDAFVERILESVGGVFSTFSIYIGSQLGLYEALAEYGAMTSNGLARLTGTNERYIREWLEQQTVTGVLEVKNPEDSALERCYRLPAGHAEVLVEKDSLNYIAPLAQLAVGAVSPIRDLLDAYRTGVGIPYRDYGMDLVEGQAAINRAMFLQELGHKWLPTLPDVHAHLSSESPAKIADIGCGAGWSSIGMAQAYVNAFVDGYDLDGPSIELARTNAQEAGLNGRVAFHIHDAADGALDGQYDLVTAFECVHDMADPVSALRTMYRLAKEDGAVIIADERVGEEFSATGNEVEWMMYGWSILHCLPVGMAEHPAPAGTGTVMRPKTLRAYANKAGFDRVEILPIENFFFRFYRLHK